MAGALISLYMYLTNTRFELHTTKDGAVYKFDKKTGQTWFVKGIQENPVKEGQKNDQKTPEMLSPEDLLTQEERDKNLEAIQKFLQPPEKDKK